MSEQSSFRRLANNTRTFAIGNIATKLSQYLVIFLCTHRLTTADFGISDTVIQTVAILVPIFSIDIAEGIFRFTKEPDYSSKQLISSSMLFNYLGIGIALVAFPIEYVIFRELRIPIYITALAVAEMIQATVKEYIRGQGKTKTYVIGGCINAIVQIAACAVFVNLLNMGISGYILAIAVAYCVEIVYCSVAVDFPRQITRNSVDRTLVNKLFKYSYPLVPNKVMWWIISASDRYFVLWLLGASETGIYAVAAKFPALITIIEGFFFQAWQVSALETKDSTERDEFYSKIFNLLWLFAALLTCGLLIVIKLVVKIMVPEEYFFAWKFAPFLFVSAAISAIQSFLGVNYTVYKDSIGALRSTCIAAGLNLILNYFLIKILGIQGATIATLMSFIAVAVYRYLDTRKYVRIQIDNQWELFLTYGILIGEGILLWFIPDYHYLITIIGLMLCLVINHREIVNGFSNFRKIIRKEKIS